MKNHSDTEVYLKRTCDIWKILQNPTLHIANLRTLSAHVPSENPTELAVGERVFKLSSTSKGKKEKLNAWAFSLSHENCPLWLIALLIS